ncbi:MAG: tripartite tricarboxylate transporter substrate binding protein [Betaproteobacteria bacterium]|nr:tripartite tricarboxylate transporter substrate binding protein [Betaproteobacteria bacterium]
MNLSRKLVALLSCGAVAFAALTPMAPAADFPTKPIRIVVPYPPGGSADLIGRMVAEKMSKSIGQPVIVENKGGATGAIGSEFVARAEPDGYTVLVAIADTHAINPAVVARLPYDPLKDFVPISLMATQPFVLALGPGLQAKNVAEFVAAAKEKPGAITYASNGTGGLQHLAMELFSSAAGIKTLHVPYKGAGPALTDVMGGQVNAIFISLQGGGSNLKTEKLRPLAITAATRLAVAPEIPTFVESGYPKFQMSQWYGLLAPKGTPADIVEKLNQHVRAALSAADVADSKAAGTEPVGSSPEQFPEIPDWRNRAGAGAPRPTTPLNSCP